MSIVGSLILKPAEQALINASPEMPLEHEGPVFREPWEAQAFAMAVALHERGVFSWGEWAEMLGEVIRQDALSPTGQGYYQLWLKALERIIADKRVVAEDEREIREREWHAAAARTPHGMPIML
ncbi:MAG: nitrile hydratase accessory protein [Nitratireductor sp.]|nr:nitrile hydratase accessory protein [Nitratireductor sp.]